MANHTERTGDDMGSANRGKNIGPDEKNGPKVQHDDSGQAHTNAQTRTGDASDRDTHDITSGIETRRERED
jgi:hypothetical protein